jgi:uncharacterized membrane protein YbhN (UPF0104 family)
MSVHSASVARLSWLRHIVGSIGLRVGITLLLLGIVAAGLGWSSVVAHLRNADAQYVIAAILLIMLALVIGAYRWRRLVIATDIHLSFPELARAYALSRSRVHSFRQRSEATWPARVWLRAAGRSWDAPR